MKNKSKKKGCLAAVLIPIALMGAVVSCFGGETDVETTTTKYITEEVATVQSTAADIFVSDTGTNIGVTTSTEKETTTNKPTTEKETTTQKPSTTEKKTTTTKKVTETKKAITTKNVTTTKKKVATTKQIVENSQKIYRTESGKKYHYENPCGNGDYYEVSLDDALAAGLEPCKKCVLH